ncbi:MAG: hypothetical protein KGH60_02910 [Candidatus Micrarchaeota archaeon]|nr:hypothetical protein [Candidatus Micrarchaeota archaeon]
MRALRTLPFHNGRRQSIRSCLNVRSELLLPLAQLKAHLSGLACLKPASSGTILRYLLMDSESKDVATIEFSRDGVIYSSHIDSFSNQRLISDMVKFLCLLAYVSRFYNVMLKELYPSLIEALRLAVVQERGGADLGSLDERLASLNEMNLSLSRKLLSLHLENASLSDKLDSYKAAVASSLDEAGHRFGPEVAKALSLMYGQHSVDAEVQIR